MNKRTVPAEALANLRVRLAELSPRSVERKTLIAKVADLYDVSRASIYRALNDQPRPKSARRADFGQSRKVSTEELDKYCKLIAALKVRTENKKRHHISTAKAIEILELGVDAPPYGFVQAPPGVLCKSLVNRHMKALGYDRKHLQQERPCVRFQAERSNDCWQFDISPSDMKEVEEPSWIEPGRGKPTLSLFSIVDDRSGASYTEYWSVYGEEVETALRFLYNAMAPKKDDAFLLQGIPKMIYLDNGPVAKSNVFKRVMFCLGINWQTHEPKGADKLKTSARAKGKVERPFRTVKEAHEALYHFHKPKNEAEANEWLMHYLTQYNRQKHRIEDHSRLEDWVSNLPEEGFQAVCSWEKFRSFAREPESKKVEKDATIAMDNVRYEVSPELVGEKVVVWWGLFDNELYVEHDDKRYGPYKPSGGPVPLHSYRRHKKTKREKDAEKINEIAQNISVSKTILSGKAEDNNLASLVKTTVPSQPFVNRFEPVEPDFKSSTLAKMAIKIYLGISIADLPAETQAFIEDLVAATLNKTEVMTRLKAYIAKTRRKETNRAH